MFTYLIITPNYHLISYLYSLRTFRIHDKNVISLTKYSLFPTRSVAILSCKSGKACCTPVTELSTSLLHEDILSRTDGLYVTCDRSSQIYVLSNHALWCCKRLHPVVSIIIYLKFLMSMFWCAVVDLQSEAPDSILTDLKSFNRLGTYDSEKTSENVV